jgi:hypothetical protein
MRAQGLQTDLIYLTDRELYSDCWPFNILNPEHLTILRESLAVIEPDCVIIDTLRECCTGADENNSTEMQEVVAYLTAAVTPAALVLVHHGKKPNVEAGHSTINNARGSSYISGKMDSIVHFSTDGIDYTGRAVEAGDLSLVRIPRGQPGEGTWKLAEKESNKKMAQILLADDSFPSLRSKAREFASRTGKSEDAALSYLSRLQD